MNKSIYLRFIFYCVIWIAYLTFMKIISPLGIDWLPWHQSRMINFTEFFKSNPYWDTLGFSVWNECMSDEDCPVVVSSIKEQIYLSKHSVVFLHFLFINSYFGNESLLFFGPLVDKACIFISAILCAEISINLIKSLSNLPQLLVGIISFSLFSMSPWTYKMILNGWAEIYFLMFALLAFASILKQKYGLSLIFLFLCSIYNYQWSLLIAIFIILVSLLSTIFNEKNINIFSVHPSDDINRFNIRAVASILIPVFIFALLRFFAAINLDEVMGSSLLTRIGISGNDIHNGGIFGALQFLGGNRISYCINFEDLSFLSGDLRTKIVIFNCLLSIAGMYIISIISIIGIILLLWQSKGSYVLLPLIFALISIIMMLQQSLSIHLMGYSYIFSTFFAIGLTTILVTVFKKVESIALKTIFISPIFAGILILCIHISMLTGVNG